MCRPPGWPAPFRAIEVAERGDAAKRFSSRLNGSILKDHSNDSMNRGSLEDSFDRN
jgi:hypothetical protein